MASGPIRRSFRLSPPGAIVLAAVYASLHAGCAGPPGPNEATACLRAWFPQLQEGTTMRADVLLALGLPAMTFDDDSLLLYRVAPDEDGRGHAVSWLARDDSPFARPIVRASIAVQGPDPRRMDRDRECTLVLAFDMQNVLQRAALVAP